MSDAHPVFEKIPVHIGELFTLRADKHENFPGLTVVPHYHMMYELMWFRYSSGQFTIGGESFHIKNNTLVFVPALMIHDLSLEKSPTHLRYLLQFEKDWLDEFMISSAVCQRGAVLEFDEADALRLEMLFAWCNELNLQKGSQDRLFKSLLKSLLLDAFNRFDNLSNNLEREVDRHLTVLLNFIHELDKTAHYSITTEEAAQACNWSKSWFSKTFRSHFGMSMKTFMLLRKINIAVRLLSATDMRISEISNQAGFTDSAYFCLKFRQLFSQTPLAFRDKIRSTQDMAS